MSLASDAPPLAVIGAGIVGCALALALDHAGVPVVLLDRDRPRGPRAILVGAWPSRRMCLRS